jgi:hypothetical protein
MSMSVNLGKFYALSVYEPSVVRQQQRDWAIHKRKLKTELKKIGALLKKIKFINSGNLEAIKVAVNTINLQKFIDEIISTVSKGKITHQNVEDIVVVIGLFHQRYPKFIPSLTNSLNNIFIAKIRENNILLEETTAIATLMCELYMQGIIWEYRRIEEIFSQVCNVASTIPSDGSLESATFVVAFAATCHSVLSQASISGQVVDIVFLKDEIETNRLSGISKLRVFLLEGSRRIFYNVARVVETVHRRIVSQVNRNNDNSAQMDYLGIKNCKNILLITNERLSYFSKSLGITMPDTCKFNFEEGSSNEIEVGVSLNSKLPSLVRASLRNNRWKELTEYSQKERQFYILVKNECVKKYFHDEAVSVGGFVNSKKQSKCSSMSANFTEAVASIFKIKEERQIDNWMLKHGKQLLVANKKLLLTKLVDFDQIKMCNCRIHAKIIIIISYGIPDFGISVIRYLVEILKKQLEKKKQYSYERLMVMSNYIGELCIFDVCPMSIIMDILCMCVKDFRGVNARICCYIIIKCGNCIYASPSSKKYMESILNIMGRLLQVKALGYATKILIEEAIFATRLSSNKYKFYHTGIMEEYLSFLLDFAPHSSQILSQKFTLLPWYFGKKTKNNMFVERLFLSKIGSTKWASKVCEFLKHSFNKNGILQNRYVDSLFESFEHEMFVRQTANCQKFQFLLVMFKTSAKHNVINKLMLSGFLIHLMKEIEEETHSLAINGVLTPDLIARRLFYLVGLIEVITEKSRARSPSLLHETISTLQLRISHLLDKYGILNNIRKRISYKIKLCKV